jgi:hypothetical protein
MPKIGCPKCRDRHCKLHKTTLFSLWWYKNVLDNWLQVKWAVIALIKGEKSASPLNSEQANKQDKGESNA